MQVDSDADDSSLKLNKNYDTNGNYGVQHIFGTYFILAAMSSKQNVWSASTYITFHKVIGEVYKLFIHDKICAVAFWIGQPLMIAMV